MDIIIFIKKLVKFELRKFKLNTITYYSDMVLRSVFFIARDAQLTKTP